jgi:hypothetical protein
MPFSRMMMLFSLLFFTSSCTALGNYKSHYICRGVSVQKREDSESRKYGAILGLEIQRYNLPWGRGAYINFLLMRDIENVNDRFLDLWIAGDEQDRVTVDETGGFLRIQKNSGKGEPSEAMILYSEITRTLHYVDNRNNGQVTFDGTCELEGAK